MSTQARKTTQHAPTNLDESGASGPPLLEIHQAQVNLPYPPPQIIAQYNEAENGLGSKMIDIIDRESAHRHECSVKALDSDIRARDNLASNERLAIWAELFPRLLGQLFAFLLCAGALGGGYLLASNGKEWPGTLFGAGGVIGLAWIFLKSGNPSMPPPHGTAPRQRRAPKK